MFGSVKYPGPFGMCTPLYHCSNGMVGVVFLRGQEADRLTKDVQLGYYKMVVLSS